VARLDGMSNAMTAGFGRPDWVMCGMAGPAGGVRLLASKDMTHAELSADYDWADIGPWSPPMLRSRRITLTSGLKTFIVIDAPDYPSAFRALFEQWTPGPGERAALAGIPAIEAAPRAEGG
jgi:hypothetical protein